MWRDTWHNVLSGQFQLRLRPQPRVWSPRPQLPGRGCGDQQVVQGAAASRSAISVQPWPENWPVLFYYKFLSKIYHEEAPRLLFEKGQITRLLIERPIYLVMVVPIFVGLGIIIIAFITRSRCHANADLAQTEKNLLHSEGKNEESAHKDLPERWW